jgi:hypothetical protein
MKSGVPILIGYPAKQLRYFKLPSPFQPISAGLQRPSDSGDTRPQVWQEYFIAESFSLQIWLTLTSGVLQYEHAITSCVGLQR